MRTPSFRAAAAVVVVATILMAACDQGTRTPTPAASVAAPTSSSSADATAPVQTATPGPSATELPSGNAFDPAAVAVAVEPFVAGLESPLAVTHAGDGSGRLFVAEQFGRIRIVRDGSLVERPFLDIADRISAGGERGLLGLAFHPNYPADPRFFVDYTDNNGDTQVSSFAVDPGNPDQADAASEKQLVFVKQPYANHNGGVLAFGPDNSLYIGMGDGGSGGDPHNNGQSLDTLLGKILRIDVDRSDGDRAYGVPTDNPFAGPSAGEDEIWLYGLRNPWRMSFDRSTGDLWIGDVGQNAWEEIDVARAGTGGLNLGWNVMEGAHCFGAQSCDQSSLTPPVAEYSHDVGCTVIGGGVYRGAAQSALAGGYLFGDYCSGLLWAIDPAAAGPSEPVVVAETKATISSFGEDEAGEMYLTDLSSGELLRVTAGRR